MATIKTSLHGSVSTRPVLTLHHGASAPVALVGNEGLVDIALFMGGESTTGREVVQSAGKDFRLTAPVLMQEFNRAGVVMHLLLRYTQALITQITQTGAARICAAAAARSSPLSLARPAPRLLGGNGRVNQCQAVPSGARRCQAAWCGLVRQRTDEPGRLSQHQRMTPTCQHATHAERARKFSARLILTLLAPALATACIGANAQTAISPTRGQLLYATHCIACHSTQMHWRDQRQAKDWDSLRDQVRRWQASESLQWSDADISEVTRHLNATVYRFPLPDRAAAMPAARRGPA